MVRTPFVAQQSPRKQNVLRRDRLPVGKTRPRIEAERDITSGVVGFHASGQQAIQREGLVIAPGHQALDDKAPDLLHRYSPDDEGVEAVERPENALNQPAALGRVRIGVGHMGEIGR